MKHMLIDSFVSESNEKGFEVLSRRDRDANCVLFLNNGETGVIPCLAIMHRKTDHRLRCLTLEERIKEIDFSEVL